MQLWLFTNGTWDTIYHSEGQTGPHSSALTQALDMKGKKAMTTTIMHRPAGIRASIQNAFSAVAATLAEIYGREGATEPKSEAWNYFAA